MSSRQFSSSLGVKAVMVASQVKVTGIKLSLICCFYYHCFCQAPVQVQTPLPTDPYVELKSPFVQKMKTLKHYIIVIIIIIVVVVIIVIIIIVCRS